MGRFPAKLRGKAAGEIYTIKNRTTHKKGRELARRNALKFIRRKERKMSDFYKRQLEEGESKLPSLELAVEIARLQLAKAEAEVKQCQAEIEYYAVRIGLEAKDKELAEKDRLYREKDAEKWRKIAEEHKKVKAA